MNKIYRRIWNTAKNCWAVGSELSSPRGKASQSGGHSPAGAFVIAAALLFPAMAVHSNERAKCADGSEDCSSDAWTRAMSTISTPFSLSLPEKQDAPRSDNTDLAYGKDTQSASGGNVLLGHSTQAYGNAVAMGREAKARASHGVAIGFNAEAVGGSFGAIAIGTGAKAGQDGRTSGAIAVGRDSEASNGSTAIGYQARAYGNNSAAIGPGSRVEASQSNVVSVGRSGSERRIVNLQDGNIGKDSTDAVNGRQLYNLNSDINGAKTIAAEARDKAIAVAGRLEGKSVLVGEGAKASTESGVGIGAAADAGMQAVAIGLSARATGDDAVAIGRGSSASAFAGTAVGAQSTASRQAAALGQHAKAGSIGASAFGYSALAGDTNAVALGANSKANHTDSVALGSDAETTGSYQVSVGSTSSQRKIVNMADGLIAKGSTEAVTGSQLFETDKTAKSAEETARKALDQAGAGTYLSASGNVGSETNKAKAVGVGALAYGTEADAQGSSALALGTSAKARQANAVAVGGGTTADHANSVALGYGSVTSAANQVSVGTSSAKRKIVNVADGALSATSNEAVTGAQLFATDKTARNAGTSAEAAKKSAENALSDAKDALEKIGVVAAQSQYFQVGSGGDGAAGVAGLVAVAIGDSAVASPTSEGGGPLAALAMHLGQTQ